MDAHMTCDPAANSGRRPRVYFGISEWVGAVSVVIAFFGSLIFLANKVYYHDQVISGWEKSRDATVAERLTISTELATLRIEMQSLRADLGHLREDLRDTNRPRRPQP